MAYPLDFCDAPISCHAWNADGSMVALCPNTPDILIYRVDGKKFELLYTLKEHTQLVTSVDWNHKTGQIISCSQDRNAYVWTFDEATRTWKKELVQLRLGKAATYCRWSPEGNSFAVATGTSKFKIGAWNEEQKWWQTNDYSNEEPTGLSVNFHPDSQHVLVSGTSRHCDYVTLLEEERTVKRGKNGKEECYTLGEWSSQGWSNFSCFSPSGKWLAFASQDATIGFVRFEEIGAKDAKNRRININGLPLLTLAFLSETTLVGAGFDCAPRIFVLQGDDWVDLGLIDVPEMRDVVEQKATGVAARAALFGGKSVPKSSSIHNNVIHEIRTLPDRFTTSANDGRIGVWPFAKIREYFGGKVQI